MKLTLRILMFVFAMWYPAPGVSAGNTMSPEPPFKSEEILSIMHRVADWQLRAWDREGYGYGRADWVNSACYTGLYATGVLEGGEKYLHALLDIGNKLNWDTGHRRFYADDYCIGQTYAQLYMTYGDKKMITSFTRQADSIIGKPNDEPLHWGNNIQYREWAWCDALFMGPPSLAYLSTATGNPEYLNVACRLWWKTTDFLYDEKEKLYFRDGSYFGQKEKNGAKVFWSRGNGWVVSGLARVLENMPSDHPDRVRFEKLFKAMMKRLASLQQPDGSWHTSLLDPQSYPVKEMSGTGFFCHAFTWGINRGLLDESTYLPVVRKAWKVLVSAVREDGKLGYVQPVGASPGKVDADSTEAYGVGAFLLAGAELYKHMINKDATEQ
ncbi:glycoside hydrolase family 88/105 protein [Sinomicrobium soli]|uniref:glycoside hydrolase family 88/105 protein n=1 Tax=Sinomicrobium sp. N-1-3-6 TaxID=2219864 RepID=UPI000DCB6C7F|nr:glycoside hydrolase family 88 protein [Sinomicrobium sp. N-1-3-6]RAV31016.1 glycoside hydrolase family 88 protein [Sinomicrobium sp. N-1-3-6]